MEHQLVETELILATSNIWALSLQLPPSEQVERVEWEDNEALLVGQIDLTGDWAGRILVALPPRLATLIAQRMFDGLPSELLTIERVIDAVLELTNMIGGNIKSALPASCDLSTPVLRETSARSFLSERADMDICFKSFDSTFLVRVSKTH